MRVALVEGVVVYIGVNVYLCVGVYSVNMGVGVGAHVGVDLSIRRKVLDFSCECFRICADVFVC